LYDSTLESINEIEIEMEKIKKMRMWVKPEQG